MISDVLGINDPAGAWYLFWSGFGADLGYLAVAYSIYNSKTCDVKRCFRYARVPVKNTGLTVCRKHAKSKRPTVQELARLVGEDALPKEAIEKLED